jgi:hypothetical protein
MMMAMVTMDDHRRRHRREAKIEAFFIAMAAAPRSLLR